MSHTRTIPDGQADKILDSTRAPEFLPSLQLDSDRMRAIEKMIRIQELEQQLPGLRCGSCGAPSCHAFAEDVSASLASGMNAHIAKPIDVAELTRLLKKHSRKV